MTQLDFGPLILGGNVFGWTADEATSFALLDRFTEAGGRAIDTADSYSWWLPGHSGGESEAIIGNWLRQRGRRDDVVIATKVFQHPERPGLAPENIRAAVEDSLRRLGTDYIDVYFAHRDDDAVPQEEYLAAFDELVRAGKVREVGASLFTAERLRSAAEIAHTEGLTPFTVSQDLYSLVERELELEIIPTLTDLGMVEQPFSALANGFLTGKYRPGYAATPGDSPRAGQASTYLDDPRNVALLRTLDDVAAAHNVGIGSVALAWLRSRDAVAAPVASASRVEQLATLTDSFNLVLSEAEVAALTAASEHTATRA